MKYVYAVLVYCDKYSSNEKWLDKIFIDYSAAEEYAEKCYFSGSYEIEKYYIYDSEKET